MPPSTLLLEPPLNTPKNVSKSVAPSPSLDPAAIYNYSAKTGFITICAWCPDKEELEARAAIEFPHALVTHARCSRCLQKLKDELEREEIIGL